MGLVVDYHGCGGYGRFLEIKLKFLLQSCREDVWSCKGLEEDGFPIKEQSQVKVTSGGEEVRFKEDFCPIGEGVAFEGPVFEGIAEKSYSGEEVVRKALAFEKDSEGVAEKAFSGKEVVGSLAAKKVFEGITVKKGVTIEDQVSFREKIEKEDFL